MPEAEQDVIRAGPGRPKPADLPPRRPPRGYVDSYGEKRVCSRDDCTTTLSRYNSSELCWTHENEALSDQ